MTDTARRPIGRVTLGWRAAWLAALALGTGLGWEAAELPDSTTAEASSPMPASPSCQPVAACALA